MGRRKSITQPEPLLHYCHRHLSHCENATYEGHCSLTICDRITDEDSCEHERIYDMQTIYATFPAQADWICRKCGKRGCGQIGRIQESEFERVVREFDEGERNQC